MTQDLRQAILALTNAAKEHNKQPEISGIPHMIDERLIENVLELMPAGPILETLWAGLPVPTAVMSARVAVGYVVTVYYGDCEQADRVHEILAKPKHDFCDELLAFAKEAEARSAKAKLERTHALEKRLLAEREAFTLVEERVPDVLDVVLTELAGMADSSFLTEEEQQAAVDAASEKIMGKIKEAATAPVRAVVEAAEEAQADDTVRA